MFTGSKYETDLKTVKVSDILKGDFAPIVIPVIEIPGTRPLVYEEPAVLLAEINENDQFFIDELEEEYLMFTAEMEDRTIRRQDGPHQTLRWRKKVRDYLTRPPKPPTPEENPEQNLEVAAVALNEDSMTQIDEGEGVEPLIETKIEEAAAEDEQEILAVSPLAAAPVSPKKAKPQYEEVILET